MPAETQRVRSGARVRPRAERDLRNLTVTQRAAVTHTGGPVLLLAGAGTGKTLALVERVAWLVSSRGIPPQSILALTFTDKAASELQERIDLALPISAFQPWVGTFHAFGEFILREEAFARGLAREFRILSAPEAWLLLRRNLFALPLSRFRPAGNPTKFVQVLAEFFRDAKDQGITPDDLAEYAKRRTRSGHRRDPGKGRTARATAPRPRGETGSGGEAAVWRELAGTYRVYVRLQRREGMLDVGDLLLETLHLFRERPDVLAKYRARFPHIVVDEFQDTNAAQGELLELLAAPSRSLARRGAAPLRSLVRRGAGQAPLRQGSAGQAGSFLVASDDDQAIFAFRGSHLENVLQFRERFPGATILGLTENFRSPQVLLDHAYALIQHNNPFRIEATSGIEKRLRSSVPLSGGGDRTAGVRTLEPRVEHRQFATEEEEFAWIAEEILRLVARGVAYREIAILVRTNALAADLVPPLLRRDIPHVIVEARGLLARPEVKDAYAYFRLLADPADGRSFFRLLCHPAFAVIPRDRATVLTDLRADRRPALALLEHSPLRERVSPRSREGLGRLRDLLAHHLTNFRTLRPSAVYLEFLERSGVLKHAIAESGSAPEVLPNLQAFLTYIRSLERGIPAGDLLAFLDILDAAVEGGEGPPAASLPLEVDAVHLLTVHSAKGLEFGIVFLAGATADRFPARGRRRALELPRDLRPRQRRWAEELDAWTEHVQEERRLFYVALTRAQRHLLLTSSISAAGMRRPRKPSAFIAEAGIPSLSVPSDQSTPRAQLQLPLGAAPRPRAVRDEAQTLSASKISAYEACPLQYAFRYVHQVPVPPHSAFSFGNTVHRVLKDLGEAVRAGVRPLVDEVLRWYEAHWISEGYESAEHEENRKAAGRKALTDYLASHPELLTRTPVAVEAPFSFTLPTTRVTGRIDRVDRLEDGMVIVTDFKTGSGSMSDPRTSTQLSIYALALRRAFGVEPDRLRFSFIEGGRDEETTRSPADDEQTAASIAAIATRIRAGDFQAQPGHHCRFCDFRNICDFAELP